jgi:hypothetical protein
MNVAYKVLSIDSLYSGTAISSLAKAELAKGHREAVTPLPETCEKVLGRGNMEDVVLAESVDNVLEEGAPVDDGMECRFGILALNGVGDTPHGW